ncbi:MAG TPA: hypothetical protein VKS21_07150 [Spirochaetota bacterium]|nr:hypothetical protein [Spirochaetota bacterium]
MQKYIYLLICTCMGIFFTTVFSCRTAEQLRDLDSCRKAYRSRKLEAIERLRQAAGSENRDLANAAVYYLGRYLDILQTMRAEEDISAAVFKKKQNEIYNRLLKLNDIHTNFNLKNLLLLGITKVPKQETVDFLIDVLEGREETQLELALYALRPYITNADYKTEKAVKPTGRILSWASAPVTIAAVENLLLFNQEEAALAVSNYLSVNPDDYLVHSLAGSKIQEKNNAE